MAWRLFFAEFGGKIFALSDMPYTIKYRVPHFIQAMEYAGLGEPWDRQFYFDSKKTRLAGGFSRSECDQVCKPSSVLNSHLSWPDVAITAQCHLLGTRRADASCPSAVLLRIGFAEPCGLPHAGGLLPRLSILTACAAVSLCCTFPGVAPGGR